MMCVCASIGTWAGTISNDNGWLKLENLQPGDLAKAIEGQYTWTGDASALNSATQVVFGSNVRLKDEDLAALKTLIPAAKQLNMAQVTLDADANITSLETAAVEYLQLPNSMATADGVKEMASLKSKNSALKVVGAYDADHTNKDDSSKKWAAVAIHSFEANKVSDFLTQMNVPKSGNPTDQNDTNPSYRRIFMSGEYGDKDIYDNGAVLGYGISAEWDFTGAHFADCTITESTAKYYNYDDPFCKNGTVAPSTSSNAFYYFAHTSLEYQKKAVSIKLPDNNMTHLPKASLYELGKANTDGYVALYGQSEYDSNKEGNECVPLETLVIPECYTDLDEGCGESARIRHLYVGKNVKRIHGGAFLGCPYLEDLDFAAGLSDCYIGDQSFNECNKMKHIALSEGVVSLGNGCFWNSQQLESIRLPQSLRDMGNNCFNNCLALNSITIPENVEKIGQNAFKLCPFTDVYLTTTDPDKIPFIWSAGTGHDFDGFDSRSTFYNSHIFGWSGIPDTPDAPKLAQMTWDEAADYYFMNVNGCPVLHYPSQLAEKVREDISGTYHAHTKADETGKVYPLPLRADINSRAQIPDCGDSENKGKYTQNGWAQFMLMKAYVTNGPTPEVYQKEYDDVWYTMCFPFDLTDEQLAAAFNETFNIVDFSGVEVKEADENNGKMKLILHFKNVAVTDYKDTEGKHYKRVLSNGSVIRETDPKSKFSYNVYTDGVDQYHHVNVSSKLETNKTKTFAKGSSMTEAQANFDRNHEAFMIDGILATAGHPYLIHPAIGVVAGQPKQRCNFSGIEWLPQGISFANWEKVFKENSRTIDLGVKKTEVEEPDSNYTHPGYAGYGGQKYTFIGNAKEYRADAGANIPDEPQVPEKPTEPVAPPQPTETLSEPTETVSEPTPLTAEEQELVSKLTDGASEHNRGPWYGVTEEITANWSDDSNALVSKYKSTFWIYGSTLTSISAEYGTNGNPNEAGFNFCKTTFNKSLSYASDYAAYLENKALWDAYDANQAAWARYNAWQADNGESEWEHYRSLKQAYDNAVAAHDDWVANAEKWKTFIPKNAYFLGRKEGQLPKFYREIADDPAEGKPSTRTGGVWTQFTAIVIPNDAALNGIEKGISAKTAQSKGFDMLFNEDFEGTFEEDDPGIVTAIEEARKAGADVKYMDIVVSINGQVVRRGSTSIEGLPKGMYIINGKKYFVK